MTSDVDRLSSRQFKTELDAHLTKEAADQLKAEEIEEAARELIQAGQEFYPWTFEHFDEAMGNVSTGKRILVFAALMTAISEKLQDDHANHLALSVIKYTVEDYWFECAKIKAEKQNV